MKKLILLSVMMMAASFSFAQSKVNWEVKGGLSHEHFYTREATGVSITGLYGGPGPPLTLVLEKEYIFSRPHSFQKKVLITLIISPTHTDTKIYTCHT
jgi:hypothetical protein